MDVEAVAERLGVKRETVYAYVSRGLLRSERGPGGSLFDAVEVEALAGRSRRRPLPGAGIDVTLTSAVTTLRDGDVRYRGRPLADLVGSSFESVAMLLWTGELGSDAPWTSSPMAAVNACAAVDALGAGASPGDRLRVAVAAGAVGDPLRHDLSPTATVATAQGIVTTCVVALAPSTPATPVTQWGVARSLMLALAPRLGQRWVPAFDAALVLLADHELASSTLAARVAASTRADPWQVVLAGLATVSGPLHGSASAAVHRLLLDVGEDPATAVGEHLRRFGVVPGFGHLVHKRGDPRTGLLLDVVRDSVEPARLAPVDDLVDLVVGRTGALPNVDLALAALGYAANLPVGATEAIFALARIAGWIAHAMEEYREPPLRFRARARRPAR